MDVQAWTYVIVTFTFILYIAVAIWSRASSTSEFYVAGKGVSPLANGMATAADWMSAASFISMAGLISFMGRDGSIYLMGWTGGYVILSENDTTPMWRGRLPYAVPYSYPSHTSPGRCAAWALCSPASLKSTSAPVS